jgi:glycine dehydrogenase subunit 2
MKNSDSPLVFELSREGQKGYSLPKCDVPELPLAKMIGAANLRAKDAALPELSENEIVRHYIRLSNMNHHIDKAIYPLGSCTMKYNPKVNEKTAADPGWTELHPFQPARTAQGALHLMYDLARMLAEVSGMDEVTLQPVAGAQGEFTGIQLAKAHFKHIGEPRVNVLMPDSAHGTNPASVTMSGYKPIQIKSSEQGILDPAELEKVLDDKTALIMLTNPNTLGLFEREILRVAELAHRKGALVYMDGANLNALMGIARPGDMGFDMLHINLHKTFSTPHGGGGPGGGAVGVKKVLEPYLPLPIVRRDEKQYYFDYDRPLSIGRMHSFYGNFGMMVRAYTYILMHGAQGLRDVSEAAILNANYLKEKLRKRYKLPYDFVCQHEFVLSGDNQKKLGIKTLDIAKRLLDYGVHAPTTYFPLIVSEALMIEPTETETKRSLDEFVEIMLAIADEVETNPDIVKNAPQNTPVARLDEVYAAKELNVAYHG